ncbi:Serine/threonine/dual specificity protein kinase, catalytic domain [Lasallia pustulata]|uniref:Serine/threonine/dual specificity protein kinase, catalytic domain n=1 Tax=Lasallia pustulata TaxID=136370 RepID=A0A1W5CYL7_9LECA|nr:Serine/threonine/dual specificity protein kinase, catalytic domain [Lasallia pustulata]
MSISGSGNTWLSIRDEKKHSIKEHFGQGYSVLGDISSGRSFRAALEDFSSKKGERRVERLEAKLFPSYIPITQLANAVDKSTADLQDLAPNETLEGLIWSISFALLECGCRAGAHLTPLVTLIAEHNKKVPSFSTNVGQFRLRFPNEKRVQKPLQEVYSLFIDSHLFMISHLKKRDPKSNVDPTRDESLETHIAETARQFEEARGRYDVMVHQAAEDEEREKAHLEQPSLDARRILPDHLHSNSTANREVQVQFVSIRTLGRGSYGEVDEVREFSTGASYARKHIHLDTYKPSEVTAKEVKNEVAIMQKLRHLHIATVLFYLKDEETYSIFMLPVADYDLRDFLSLCTQQAYSPALTKQINPWFGCLLDALAYAHKLKIKHQDIKPSNILIKNNQPYLSDFGLAKDFAELSGSTSRGHKLQGNMMYRAPEVLPNERRGRKADVFSLGCVYSEMFTITQGKSLEKYGLVRHEAGSVAFRDCLSTVEGWLRSFESNKLSDLLVDQILSMIHEDVKQRHTAEQAVNFLKRERALFCVE